jgi:enoyl-CoA hydratase/carnithine racemase
MTYQTITVDIAEGVAVLTLNRPQVHNAISAELRRELGDALQALRRDEAVSALVLTGAGERAFSAGLDLRELASTQQGVPPTDIRRFRWDAPHPLQGFDKPSIAAVNGLAIGGGVELALLCDIVVASEAATFAFAEVTRGIMPGNGGTQRLSRRIGKPRALEMILTGRTVPAAEALGIGLAEHVVPPQQLMERARGIARAIAANAPVAVRAARDAIHRGSEMPLAEGLALEADLTAFLYTTDDAKEGPRAFVEKRPPRWSGR